MMKFFTLYIVTILLLLTSSLAFSQKAKVTYVASTSNFVEDLKNKKNSKGIQVKTNSSDVEYKLYINKNKSYYKKEESLEADNSFINRTLVFGGRGIYYYNLKTNENLHEKENKLLDRDLLIKYEKIKWNLTKETMKIGKYKCLKATTFVLRKYGDSYKQKKIIAWYTPDIPLNFGPKNYNGLPGLILSLQEGDKLQLTAKLIELKPKEEIVIPEPSEDLEKITFKDYEKEISKKFDDFRKKKRK